jgi:hypothetical protein
MRLPTKSDVSTFINDYLQALTEVVEKTKTKILETEIKPNFPTEFPVKAEVFFSENGLLINFKKADKFSLEFLDVRPTKSSYEGEFLPYRFFDAWKGKADKKAQADVDSLLALPAMVEEHEEDMQAYYEAELMEIMELDIDTYFGFLNKADAVVSKSKESAFNEVHEIVAIRQTFLRNFEFLLRSGCQALNNVYFLIDSEMETSFDLALHGRYIQSMASLRKVLEVSMRALRIDCISDKKVAQEKLSDWIDKGEDRSQFREVIQGIIPEDADEELTKIVNETAVHKWTSCRADLPAFYHDLCKYVHLRPKTYNYDLILFPEFNPELFTAYHDTLLSILRVFEALLILNFPAVVAVEGIGPAKEKYNSLVLSKGQSEAIVRLAKS